MITNFTGPSLSTVVPESKEKVSKNNLDLLQSCLFKEPIYADYQLNTWKDGIYTIDDVLSKDECNQLCKCVDQSSALSFWSPQGRNCETVRVFRDADTLEVNSEEIANTLWKRIHKVIQTNDFNKMIPEDDTHPEWERELPGLWIPSGTNKDLLFARYPSFGAFAPHTDGRAIQDFNCRSFYSIILFLNDIPPGCGGGTKFYKKEATEQLEVEKIQGIDYWTADEKLSTTEINPKAGRMLIFHQSLVHQGLPSLAPYTKYIIRSDVMFSRTPAICDSTSDREAYQLFRQAEDAAEQGRVDESIPLFKKALKLSPALAQIMGQG